MTLPLPTNVASVDLLNVDRPAVSVRQDAILWSEMGYRWVAALVGAISGTFAPYQATVLTVRPVQ